MSLKSTPEDFWSRCKKDVCWDWTGPKQKDGYGILGYHGKSYLAHRLAYILSKGPISQGSYVCHTCDNPSCINPLHLYEGNQYTNMRDMVIRKRRDNTGEKHPRAKLSKAQVDEIRNHYTGKHGEITRLSKKYNMSISGIASIVKRINWK